MTEDRLPDRITSPSRVRERAVAGNQAMDIVPDRLELGKVYHRTGFSKMMRGDNRSKVTSRTLIFGLMDKRST